MTLVWMGLAFLAGGTFGAVVAAVVGASTVDRPPLSRTWLLPRPDPLACYECGLVYGSPGWCDVVIPDEDWLAISPTGHGGGVLCFTCMARRLTVGGREGVPMAVTSGPFTHHPTPRVSTVDREDS